MKVGDTPTVKVTEVAESYAKLKYEKYEGQLTQLDLSWALSKRGDPVSEFLSQGQLVHVRIIAIRGKRFSASLKHLVPNPWDNPPRVGTTFMGTVWKPTEYGYFVWIADYFEGLLLIEDATEEYKESDMINVTVKSCDSERRRIYFDEANDA